jgi:hypothetical protein
MSVSIATLGMYDHPSGPVSTIDDLGSDPIALGGGMMPGSYFKEKKRLKVSVRQVNSFNERFKIKVVVDD